MAESDPAPVRVPAVLFHGTPVNNIASIEYMGLDHGDRAGVQLASDEREAQRFGARRGRYVVFAVDADAMRLDGHEFSLSDRGVWEVGHVPPRYLSRVPAGLADVAPASQDDLPYLGCEEDEESPQWWDFRAGSRSDQSRARHLTTEMKAEVGPGHVLFDGEVVASYAGSDDVLVRLGDGRWSIVHLTWNKTKRPDTLGHTGTKVFDNRDELQAALDAMSRGFTIPPGGVGPEMSK